MPLDYDRLITYGLALVAVYLLLRALVSPLRWLLVGTARLAIGGLAIWALNLLGVAVGFHLALNPATALVAGFLGVPGIALLVALRSAGF